VASCYAIIVVSASRSTNQGSFRHRDNTDLIRSVPIRYDAEGTVISNIEYSWQFNCINDIDKSE